MLRDGAEGKGECGGGRVLVTLFEGEPYATWDVKGLAKRAGLRTERSWRFDWESWSRWGYRHARTLGDLRLRAGKDRDDMGNGEVVRDKDEEWHGFSDSPEAADRDESTADEEGSNEGKPGRWRGEDREARCYCFYVPQARGHRSDQSMDLKRKKKRKRKDESESDD